MIDLLRRIKGAVVHRWSRSTRERGKAHKDLRALALLPDTAVLDHLDLERLGLAASSRGSGECSADALLSYFRTRPRACSLFKQEERAAFVSQIRERFPQSVEDTLRRADLACGHVIEVLGSGETYLGHPINWWSNFRGRTWAEGDYQDLNRTLYGNDFQSELYIGDIKLPWELNKHAHFVDLARAYWLTSDERYAEALLGQMDDWIQRNPFLYGVAWTQNLIVAQRVIGWILALDAVRNSPHLTSHRLLRILRSLYQHGSYIQLHWEFSQRASNHLFGNASGLAALAVAYPEFREAASWRAEALEIIETELNKQVYADGVQYEQSINYHRYVVEFCLLPWLLTDSGRCPYSEPSRATLRRMLEFLLHMTQPNGTVQPISDADGARVWRFSHYSINDHRGVLNLGAALFQDGALKNGMQANSEDVLWWLGISGYSRWQGLSCPAPVCSMAFPHGGYFVLREAWTSEAMWAFFDCGNVGMGDWPDDLSVGTHGHSDLLTFGLAVGGETLLTDIGSYTYTGSKRWHDYFRSARGHNVVLIDGEDQSVLTTTWALRERARPKDVQWHFSHSVDFVTGAHDGYRRLIPPVLHRRSLLFFKSDRTLVLRDDLEGEGLHRADLLFHAMPKAAFTPTPDPNSWELVNGQARLMMTFIGDQSDGFRYRVTMGQSDPIDGWYADDYGCKEPAPVLHVSFEGTCPLRVYTIFTQNGSQDRWRTFEQADRAWTAALDVLQVSRGELNAFSA